MSMNVKQIPSNKVETLLNAKTSTGAGSSFKLSAMNVSFQAVANGTSGAFSSTVYVQVSNDNSNWETVGTISLSGTATTADSDGFSASMSWVYIRGYVNAISGTGANVTLYMGV